MTPSWPGLLVILAFPSSVRTIAPLVRRFRRTKLGFATFSTTVSIFTRCDLPVAGSATIADAPLVSTWTRVPPWVLTILLRSSPMCVSAGVFPSSAHRFPHEG